MPPHSRIIWFVATRKNVQCDRQNFYSEEQHNHIGECDHDHCTNEGEHDEREVICFAGWFCKNRETSGTK